MEFGTKSIWSKDEEEKLMKLSKELEGNPFELAS